MAHIVAAGTGADAGSWCGCGWVTSSARGRLGQRARARSRRCLPVDGQALPTLPGSRPERPRRAPGGAAGRDLDHDAQGRAAAPGRGAAGRRRRVAGGLVLANAGLIEDLRASRQRLVTAQDEARRRLERNIHDGAQQDLVALASSSTSADVTVGEDPAQAGQVFGELQADAAGALENLRDLARGIYPPLLADLGPGRGAQRAGGQVGRAGDGRRRRDRAVRAGHRGGGVFLLPGGAAEHRQVRQRHPRPGSASRPRTERCASPCPTTGPATTPATPRWARACGTWPTGSPRSAAGWRSGPPPAGHHHHRAPPRPRRQRQ